jgi:hypothetical protein
MGRYDRFRAQLHDTLTARGESPRQAGRRAGLSPRRVPRLLKGARPTRVDCRALARYFDWDEDDTRRRAGLPTRAEYRAAVDRALADWPRPLRAIMRLLFRD